MRDVFYTILVVWIVWRIYTSFSKNRPKDQSKPVSSSKRQGETTLDYIPEDKKRKDFKGGDYVDYEEIK